MNLRYLWSLLVLLACSASAFAVELDQDGNPYLSGASDPADDRAPAAQGAGTVYDNLADFVAAAETLTLEDFEDEPLFGNCDAGGVAILAVSDFLVNCSQPALKILDAECFDFGNHNTTPGGVRFLNMDTDIANVTGNVMIVFPGLVNAFGLYLVDLDSSGLTATINGSSYQAVPPGGNGNGGETYFGVIDPAGFSSVQLTVDGIDSHWSVDDVSWGTVATVGVDPATWASVKSIYR